MVSPSFSCNCHADNAPLRRVKELGKRGSWGWGHEGSPMLAGQTMLFWRARALDSNETWWEGAKRGRPKLDTSVIRSALKGEKTEKGGGGEAGGSVCGAKSWTVLVKWHWQRQRGFCCLNHQPSLKLPLSLFLPPMCVFRPVMKHSNRASARGLAFPQCTSRKKSSFLHWGLYIFTDTCAIFPSVNKLQGTVSTPAYYWSRGSLIQGKVQLKSSVAVWCNKQQGRKKERKKEGKVQSTHYRGQ